MENNHLTYFKVENFKKFDSLEVNDIGQFNLIVGNNNVGKTCLLESLVLEFHAKKIISGLRHTFSKRNVKIDQSTKYLINQQNFNYDYNLIGLVQKDKNKPISIQRKLNDGEKTIYEIENLKEFNPTLRTDTNDFIKKVNLFQYVGINQISKNWLVFKKEIRNELNDVIFNEVDFIADITSNYYLDFYYYSNYLPLVRIDDFYSSDIIFFFREIVKNPRDEDHLISIVRKIFEDIEIDRFSIIEYFNKVEYLNISTKKKTNYHPINEYGDGFVRIMSILFEVLYNKYNHILIDEIEIGIHYSKMKDFWVNLMSVCKELNVQLFATTHSNECIESFMEASKEINEKNIRLIRLQENKDKSIKAICYKEEYIEYMVESNTEER